MKRLAFVVVFLAAGVGAAVWWLAHDNGDTVSFRTAGVERGYLIATVSASGVVQAEEVVDVGSQVAGRIVNFGADAQQPAGFIDYNSQVEENTVLARIDPALYAADRDLAQAALDQAEAQTAQALAQVEQADADVEFAVADLERLKALVVQNEREYERVHRLRASGGAVSDSDVVLAKGSFDAAKAAQKSGDARIKQAMSLKKGAEKNVARCLKAEVGARATLKKAQTNLDYCTIRSPVKGVIIDRRVNVGQTVVASLNAPSLFLIAKDLKRLQVWASVNEADIAQVHLGQAVQFTVDARPGEIFQGNVGQIRLNASMTQNVVTYTVVINTDNSSLKLKPYLTANATFEVARRKDVLKVPSAALRWQPRRDQVDPEHADEASQLLRRRGKQGEESREGVLWVEASKGHVRPVKVKVGLSDGTSTEVDTDELQAEDRVVIGVAAAKQSDDNPFVPKQYGSNGKSKSQ